MLTFIIHSLSRLLSVIIYVSETAGRNFCRFCYNVITVRIRLLILHVFCMQDIIRLLISQLKRTMHEYINL